MDRPGQVRIVLGRRVQRAVPEIPIRVRPPAAGNNHRQGHLAFPEIVPHRLPDHGRGATIVQRIVDNLESEPQILAVSGQGLGGFGIAH